MINELQPYPSYKSSEVEWLGDVPAHWEVKRLKTIGRIRYGLGQPPRELADGLPLIRATNVDHGRITDKNLLYIDPSDVPNGRDAILREKEIIVVRSGAYTGDSAIVPKAYDGAITGYDMVVSVTGAQPEFVAMALLCKYVRDDQLIAASTRSAQPHLNAEELGTAILLVPPLSEQTAIVAYLDQADERIRCYVSSREWLIELLEEYRQGVIHHAVTRGLDPDVRLKPSGVEWLGDVPAHWGVAAVKRHYSIQLGKMLQNGPNVPTDIAVPYLKAQHVQWFSVRTTDAPTMWASPHEIEQFGIRAGDLLVCEGGEGGRCSLVEEVPPGYIIQNALHRVRSFGTNRNDYLQYVMSSISKTGWFDAINNKATIAHFTAEKFGSLMIPIPPLPEQTAIVLYLDKATADIDAAIDRARREIELLGEYRTRLIADLVTGKVDVREAAADLPDDGDVSALDF